ncbi:rhodanese-like domain-containing protein [Acidipropionibacterium virtanenii]|uniref:rhodanese-like domain-containing protein n=1 Tax=Acidipropionibacterium virtanenii TaxID=2057246 RepID=UPI00319EB248
MLDVREDWERGIVSIPDDHWVPLGRIRQDGWDAVAGVLADSSGNPPAEVVVYCKAGVRSAEAVRLLTAGAPAGTRLRSLAGGVLAVPGAPRY